MMDDQALIMLYPCRIYLSDLLWNGLVTQLKKSLSHSAKDGLPDGSSAKQPWESGGLQDSLA